MIDSVPILHVTVMNAVVGFLVHPPSYKEHTAVVGQSYTIPCDTTVDADVRWFFDSVHGAWYLYESGRVYDAFLPRFSLNTSVRGLDISVARLNDTGNYTCVDTNGQGSHHIHELTVYGKLCGIYRFQSVLSLWLIGTVRAEPETVISRAWVQSPDPAE